jgi:uncharacterized protein with PIN domain
MTIKLYMDQHVPRAITVSLRLGGVDVLTAYEDGASQFEDKDLLDRAGELNRVLFTRDDDLLVEAARLQREGIAFTGVIYAHQLHASIGVCVRDLEIIARVGDPAEMANRVLFLPLKRRQT